jgi:hypothetical protein
MPNSAARSIELVVSRPASASPMIFAFELCARSNVEKSDEFRRMRTALNGLDEIAGVLFQRVAAGVVRGHEEPAAAASSTASNRPARSGSKCATILPAPGRCLRPDTRDPAVIRAEANAASIVDYRVVKYFAAEM